MLVEPNPTPYDINFSLFRTPVRVHITFWIFTAIMGWHWVEQPNGLVLLLLWVLCVFASILLHEFGHVIAGRLFNSDGYIVLYSFGGLAIGSSDCDRRWQRVVVSLAGPGIQLALFAALYYGLPHVAKKLFLNEYASFVFVMLLLINLWWPILNLLPIWPLDGGKVARELAQAGVGDSKGVRASLVLSIATCALVVANSLAGMRGKSFIPYVPSGGIYTVILFALLAFQSWQLLQFENDRPRWDDRAPWEQ